MDWETLDGQSLRSDNPDEICAPEIICISRMAEAYEKGILPTRGALLDQPAKAMAGIRLWARMVNKNQEILRKRMNREA